MNSPSIMCPIHNQPLKLVPAGVSKKTNRPYNAFYACPERGCDYRPEGNAVQSQAPRQTYQPQPQPANQAKPNWDKIGKMKALCGMVNGMLSHGAKPEEITSATILQLNRVVGLIETASGVPSVSGSSASPAPTAVKTGVQAAPTEEPPIESFGEPLPNGSEYSSEINVEDVPF